MRVGLLTREFPPAVYGGAGVHVGHLVPALRELVDVDVHCFAEPGIPAPAGARAHSAPPLPDGANAALTTLGVDLSMAAELERCDVLHSHTWYANMAGHIGGLLHGRPHVVTAHSLEPLRPWKAEQLGGGYRLSSWVERTAYEAADAVVAVSHGMRRDVLAAYPAIDPERVHVVHNGIDTEFYRPGSDRPDDAREALTGNGVDPDRPLVVFVGRITRQKGLRHLVAAAHAIDPAAQIVLCAGAPDTPDIAAETERAVAELSEARSGVVWIQRMLKTTEVRQLLSAATVFVCPSVYEPLGIVNLEAMACGTAVVASDVGGIPEVVADGETGLLAHYDAGDIAAFETALAERVNALVGDPERAARMGERGRERAVAEFAWAEMARRTVEVYRAVA